MKKPISKRKGSASSDKCDICGKVLSGMVVQDSWGNRAHARHNPELCDSCGRIMSRKTSAGSYQYDDGRFICGFCSDTAVERSWSASRLKRKILGELNRLGFRDIPKEVKLHIVDYGTLAHYTQSSNAKGATITQTRYEGGRRKEMRHDIYVLLGLPKVEFMAVVAHELLHVWLNEHHFKWSPRYTEGFCNLGSFWIYENDKSDLAAYLKKHLSEFSDPTYGDGFRLMHGKWKEWGWKRLIKESLANRDGFQESIWRRIFGRGLGR